MITLVNGNIQNVSNAPIVPNGSIELYLNTDATVIASPYGQVLGGVTNSIKFYFDANADIQGAAQIWSNLELNPQNGSGLGTWYIVNFYDENGTRLNNKPQTWQFTQVDGSTVDIGQMVSTSQSTIYYPLPISVANPYSFGVNVLNFHADPTGVLDSTIPLQNAINSAGTQNTFIAVPRGTYKITGSLNMDSAPTFKGIVGESLDSVVFDGTTLTTSAFTFNNPLAGFRLENFTINGPGQNAGTDVSAVFLTIDNTTVFNIETAYVHNVFINDFPKYGFYWQVPITSLVDNVVAQLIGDTAFFTDVVTPGVGGTSTTFNNCYANDVLGTGYYFTGHAYSTVNSCAADKCNISYHIFESAMTLNNCGFEANRFIDSAHPGYGVWIDSCFDDTQVLGCWGFDLPDALSEAFLVQGSANITLLGCSNLGVGVSPLQTQDVHLFFSEFCSVINCVNLLNAPNGWAIVFDDNGTGNEVSFGGIQKTTSLATGTITSSDNITAVGDPINVTGGTISAINYGSQQSIEVDVSAALLSGTDTIYTYDATTQIGPNPFAVDGRVEVTDFANAGNNGRFTITAVGGSGAASTFTVANAAGVNESAAAHASNQTGYILISDGHLYHPNQGSSLGGEIYANTFGSDTQITLRSTQAGGKGWALTSSGGASGLGAGVFSIFDEDVQIERLTIDPSGTVKILLDLLVGNGGTNLGFYGATPIPQPSITGSKGGNAALASLLTALNTMGLISDSTT